MASSDSSARLLAGIGVPAATVAALVISRWAFVVVASLILLWAAAELYRLIGSLGVAPLTIAGLGTVLACAAVASDGPETLLSALPGVIAASIVVMFLILVVGGRMRGALPSSASSVAAAVYIGGLGAFVIALRSAPDGFRVTLCFVLLTIAYESAAWIAGRLSMAVTAPASSSASAALPSVPSSSATAAVPPESAVSFEGAPPRRAALTLAGIAAGTLAVAATAALVVAGQMDPPFTMPRALILGAVIAVVLPIGSKAADQIWGSGIGESVTAPSAGSTPRAFRVVVLDRIDGVLFAAPLFYFAYRALIR